MAPKSKKKKQARLTFEPFASSSSPNRGISSARVRFSGAATSSPVRSSQSVSTRLQRTVMDDDDDEDDDDDDRPIAPSSSSKRRRPLMINLDDSDDDVPIAAPSSPLKRSHPALVELSDSDDSDVVSPVKRKKMAHGPSSTTESHEERGAPPTPGRLRRPNPTAPSPTKQSRHKGHRSEKQKKMELLRRRRAGEKINKLTSSESSSEDGGDRRGMYDTDSEDQFEVLKQFDDEEEEPENVEEVSTKKSKREDNESPRKKRQEKEDNDENDDDLDDFVTDDDDAPIGAPAHLDIPLEFTSQAHKPLKDQFPHVVEWLVHNRINPAFERKDAVYANAWRKLDDEVHGLASSKFMSAAWKVEFYRALKGRPKMEAYELPPGDGLLNTCEACGRSGHPATWKIVFAGQPYYKDTLAEVESDSSSSSSNSGSDNDEDDEDEDDTASVDTQGMTLPPASKTWFVGAVCCSNAETAHSLIHWKHALKDWVEERLGDEGHLSPAQLRRHDRMKPRRRARAANAVVDAWREEGVVAVLYADFKKNLEEARSKGTTGRGLRGRFR